MYPAEARTILIELKLAYSQLSPTQRERIKLLLLGPQLPTQPSSPQPPKPEA